MPGQCLPGPQAQVGLVPAARARVFRHDAQQALPGRADRAGQEIRRGQVSDVARADQQKSILTPQQEYHTSIIAFVTNDSIACNNRSMIQYDTCTCIG